MSKRRQAIEDTENFYNSDEDIENISDNDSDLGSDSDDLSDNVEIDDEDHVLDDKCPFRYADDLDDDEDLGLDDEEDEITIKPDERITKPFLTLYERVRLLSDRSTQLARGAKPHIKNVAGLTVEEIAELELKHKVMPLKIIRPVPNRAPEIWDLTELKF